MSSRPRQFLRFARAALVAGVAAVALAACAGPRMASSAPDYSGLSRHEAQATVAELSARYTANPRNRDTAIHFSAALRAAGQPGQAVAVLEQAAQHHRRDIEIQIAYAKALAADGRFEQALNIVEATIRPDAPDWNALSVKGVILDQTGRNAEARQLYGQAMMIAPHEPSLYANMGLSHAMTGELAAAEQYIRQALSLPGASIQVRHNLALVLGLQGRFPEARAIYQETLPPEEVEANMSYIRALLTQQNRWDVIADG